MNNNDLNSNLVSNQNNENLITNQTNVNNSQNIIETAGNNLNNNEQVLYDTSNNINDQPVATQKKMKKTIKINSDLKTAIVLALILLIAIMLIPKIFKLN